MTARSSPTTAALATIEVYEDDDLIGNAARMGEVMRRHHEDLVARHPSVGAHRNIGLVPDADDLGPADPRFRHTHRYPHTDLHNYAKTHADLYVYAEAYADLHIYAKTNRYTHRHSRSPH